MPLPEHDLTDEEKSAVLGYIREHKDCSYAEACDAVGIKRKDFRRARKESVDFDDDVRDAKGYSNEHMVNTFRLLAIEGVEEPVVSAGKIVRNDDGSILTKRVYSDRLLARGLELYTPEGKAALASKLGIEINTGGAPLVEVQKGVTTDEVLAVLRAAGKVPELEAPDGTAEVVSEEDE